MCNVKDWIASPTSNAPGRCKVPAYCTLTAFDDLRPPRADDDGSVVVPLVPSGSFANKIVRIDSVAMALRCR